MEGLIVWVKANWVALVAIYLAVHKVAVSIRDVLDKTPETDDTWFEKAVTIMTKLAGYLTTGKRPTA